MGEVMNKPTPEQIALDLATQSLCNKRKVGACIVDKNKK